MRKMVVAAMVAACVLVVATPAGAANAPGDRARCKAEYATLVGSGGERFRTVGGCVAFVARGGQFHVPFVDVLLSYSEDFFPGQTNVTIEVSGLTGDTAQLHAVIGGFVLSAEVFSSEFPMMLLWSCSSPGSVTVIDPLTGASDTEVFAPPPEACAGVVTEPDLG